MFEAEAEAEAKVLAFLVASFVSASRHILSLDHVCVELSFVLPPMIGSYCMLFR